MKDFKKRIAIVYDWIDKWGGVERVLLVLREIFPHADFFSSYVDLKKAAWAKKLSLKTTFIQNLPSMIKTNRVFSVPFYPLAFETIDFRDYDLVISVSSAFAKGIITRPKTKHVDYLLTPTRFLWVKPQDYRLTGWKKIILRPLLNYLYRWDQMAAWRPDKIIAISKTAAKRCFNYYQRKATVIYPPFDLDYWRKIEAAVFKKRNANFINTKEYYLVVARLEPYKKIDLAIKVFNRLKKTLVVVGEGSEEKRLKKMAGGHIIFLKKLTDLELACFYQNALALIMPQEEDFGYTALEAIFFQTPVISFKKGGATEIIKEGKTGIFFARQEEDALIAAIERLEAIRYNLIINLKKVRKDQQFWERFSKERFISEFKKEILNL